MRTVPLLAALLLVACVHGPDYAREPLPGLHRVQQRAIRSDLMPPAADTARAVSVFEAAWADPRVSKALERLTIEWVEALRPGQTGETLGPVRILVVRKPGQTIGTTALVHELCHVVLWALRNDPDGGHTDHEVWGDKEHPDALERRVQLRLRALGL